MPAFFEYLEKHSQQINARQDDALEYLVGVNCVIKASVVEEDEKESSLRAILNFGHSIGHAIESISGFSLLHGECVSLGMVSACSIACKLGKLDQSQADKVIYLLNSLKLPVRHDNLDVETVFNQMTYDKKNKDGRINFVLPVSIGDVVILNGIDKEVIVEGIKILTE